MQLNLPIPPSGRVDVEEAEVCRLLGYPPGERPSPAVALRMQEARDWYAESGTPWIQWSYAEINDIDRDRVSFRNAELRSKLLARRLRESRAEYAVFVGTSAGPEAEKETSNLWNSGLPDKAYVLDAYASAVVEQLTRKAGSHLCQVGEPQGLKVLPHYSPGYPGWQLEDQHLVLKLLTIDHPTRLTITTSGMLLPRKSMLAVYGLSRHPDRVSGDPRLCPCLTCVLEGCRFRRFPHQSRTSPVRFQTMERPNKISQYSFPEKALKKWTAKHLRIETQPDTGSIRASFEYEGTTCSNMGRALRFLFEVDLADRGSGYVIEACRCRQPADGGGWEHMCSAVTDTSFVESVEKERPFEGRSLEEALGWRPATNPAGCVCSPNNRNHKWQIVFQTIHFALHGEERS